MESARELAIKLLDSNFEISIKDYDTMEGLFQRLKEKYLRKIKMAEALIEAHDASNHKDCADEIERLQKWQQEAFPYMYDAKIFNVALAETRKGCSKADTYKYHIDNIDRLIAEAQEDYVDGHKQCSTD